MFEFKTLVHNIYCTYPIPNILFSCVGKSPRDNKYVGKLNTGSAIVPPAQHASELAEFRSSLPIADLKATILKEIENNRVRI